jgi:beta-glucosidase
LSYTTFTFANLKVSPSATAVGGSIEVTADVTNTGSRAGDIVAQLYIHQRFGSAVRPVRELKGFSRVTLNPGQSSPVRFILGRSELQFWSAATKDWVVEPAEFDVWVGADSQAPLHGEFRISR